MIRFVARDATHLKYQFRLFFSGFSIFDLVKLYHFKQSHISLLCTLTHNRDSGFFYVNWGILISVNKLIEYVFFIYLSIGLDLRCVYCWFCCWSPKERNDSICSLSDLVKVEIVLKSLPVDAFDGVVIDVDVEVSTVDVIVMVELIDAVSLGVIGPADCGPGVKPGWLIDFCRTSRIFNCKLCLFGNISRCFICKWISWNWIEWLNRDQYSNGRTWNSFVSFELGNMPQLLNNSMTNWRRCSNVLRWPFSAATSELQLVRVLADELPPLTLHPVPMPLLGCNGVRGVRGDRSLSFVFKSVNEQDNGSNLTRTDEWTTHTFQLIDVKIGTKETMSNYGWRCGCW